MKYLFLDIDGVLNHYEYYMREDKDSNIPYPLNEFDPLCIERLKKVLEETGARIVISSTWREEGESYMKGIFKNLGLPDDFDMTPIDFRTRGEQVQEFLDQHSCETYVILDDDSDFLDSQLSHFVKCSYNTGFDDYIMEKVMLILKG